MNFTLRVWRQAGPGAPGKMVEYKATEISPEASFLEMMDVVNEQLTLRGDEPIAFDHDCREGICGSCAMMIDGMAHGPNKGTATCQLHMRSFEDGATIFVEPWRVRAFPVVKDLCVDRSALDRIVVRREDSSPPRRAARGTRTRSWCRRWPPSSRWMRPRASAAAPAQRRAPTARPRSSLRPRSRTSPSFRRDSQSASGA